ncbi:MAG: hypothetical protein ACI4RN_00135 [Oscillospiraceae bacterium]
MSQLSKANIIEIFLKLTGISKEEFNQQEIIESSAVYIESRLSGKTLSAEEKNRCEYAAAVCGVYEYILSRNLAEKIVVTQSGKAVSDYSDSNAVSAAYKLKQTVLSSISDLIGSGFVFSTFGGV